MKEALRYVIKRPTPEAPAAATTAATGTAFSGRAPISSYAVKVTGAKKMSLNAKVSLVDTGQSGSSAQENLPPSGVREDMGNVTPVVEEPKIDPKLLALRVSFLYSYFGIPCKYLRKNCIEYSHSRPSCSSRC